MNTRKAETLFGLLTAEIPAPKSESGMRYIPYQYLINKQTNIHLILLVLLGNMLKWKQFLGLKRSKFQSALIATKQTYGLGSCFAENLLSVLRFVGFSGKITTFSHKYTASIKSLIEGDLT